MRRTFGMRKRSNMRGKPMGRTPGRMGRMFSPMKNATAAEEFKRQNKIGQDFEQRAENLFTSK